MKPTLGSAAAALAIALGAVSCADQSVLTTETPAARGAPAAPSGAGLRHLDSSGTHHSHWRYGHLTWVPRPDLGPRVIQFNYRNAFRRSGYSGTAPDGRPAVGNIITENIGATDLEYGDGTAASGTLRYVVTSINVADDWLFVEALNPGTTNPGILHTYASNGTYNAVSYSCCRIGGLLNPGNNYGASTIVTVGTGNSSPVSNIVPIINVARGGVQTWTLPGADADGDPLRFRLANTTETQGGTQPSGLTIDATTGVVTWNTTGASLGFYWTQQAVEELNADGSVKGKVTVDYLINVQNSVVANDPPVFTTPVCGGTRSVLVGAPLSIPVSASDPNAGNVVSLVASGLPPGSTFTPVSGNPASSSFNWTPLTSQTGPRVITFAATDNNGAQALCSITIVASFQVDIWPGSISVSSTPSVWAIVLSTADFDARNIDLTTVRMGNGIGTETPMQRVGGVPYFQQRDFNGDGRPDRVLFFSVADLRANGDLVVGQPELVVSGTSTATGQFRGVSRVAPTITP